MDTTVLQGSINEIKLAIEDAIVTGSYGGNTYPNGQKAKEALIRSGTLINRVHEAVKAGVAAELTRERRQHRIYPPLGYSSPELKITGFIKAKKQDVVILFDGEEPESEPVVGGPLDGALDVVGKGISERAVVIGVRSQLSSVDKNFDTLMERAFAETLNLRLRLPMLVMGEVYMLPVREYDDRAMETNSVSWKPRPVKVEKFLKTFLAISGRDACEDTATIYKYERSSLVLVDFESSPARLVTSLAELKDQGFMSSATTLSDAEFDQLAPQNFAAAIVADHARRHPPESSV